MELLQQPCRLRQRLRRVQGAGCSVLVHACVHARHASARQQHSHRSAQVGFRLDDLPDELESLNVTEWPKRFNPSHKCKGGGLWPQGVCSLKFVQPESLDAKRGPPLATGKAFVWHTCCTGLQVACVFAWRCAALHGRCTDVLQTDAGNQDGWVSGTVKLTAAAKGEQQVAVEAVAAAHAVVGNRRRQRSHCSRMLLLSAKAKPAKADLPAEARVLAAEKKNATANSTAAAATDAAPAPAPEPAPAPAAPAKSAAACSSIASALLLVASGAAAVLLL